jgi:hypothetical protein
MGYNGRTSRISAAELGRLGGGPGCAKCQLGKACPWGENIRSASHRFFLDRRTIGGSAGLPMNPGEKSAKYCTNTLAMCFLKWPSGLEFFCFLLKETVPPRSYAGGDLNIHH